MGELEISSAKRTRVSKMQKAVLGTVATVGIMSVAVLAPNALRLLKPLIKKISDSQKNSVWRARQLLISKGLLAFSKERSRYINITEKGSSFLAKLNHSAYQPKHTKRWDGKWRVLIFDISEKRKNTRHQLRSTLQAVGFARLQDSVWVYPYPCEELTALLKADFKIGSSLLYLIVEEIEGDKNLRKIFNLPEKSH